MEFFGRKRPRPRQSSLSEAASTPYDQLGPSTKPPITSGTTSQALRSAQLAISAPLTNPSLSRSSVYNSYYNDASTLATFRSKTPSSHKYRKSEASFSSGRRSPASSELGSLPVPSSPSNTILRAIPQLHPKPHTDEFYFPRPENDEDIEALFSCVAKARDLHNVELPIDQKWKVVCAAEQLRWQEEKSREGQARKQGETGGTMLGDDGSPEWYIRKFMDSTITPKEASSVCVLLRGHETR